MSFSNIVIEIFELLISNKAKEPLNENSSFKEEAELALVVMNLGSRPIDWDTFKDFSMISLEVAEVSMSYVPSSFLSKTIESTINSSSSTGIWSCSWIGAVLSIFLVSLKGKFICLYITGVDLNCATELSIWVKLSRIASWSSVSIS